MTFSSFGQKILQTLQSCILNFSQGTSKSNVGATNVFNMILADSFDIRRLMGFANVSTELQ